MTSVTRRNWLDRLVEESDHVLGAPSADITLVEYGSYACPHCRAANQHIAALRDQFGERLRYVFRHRPVSGSDLACRSAELVERAKDAKSFWTAHDMLMSRSEVLTEDDLAAVARFLHVPQERSPQSDEDAARASAKVAADIESSEASGVLVTPAFFINGRRYDGPWDAHSVTEAILGRLDYRLRVAAIDFVDWAPSAGILLLVATILAITLTNVGIHGLSALWEREFGIFLDEIGFHMPLLHWINDCLMTVFFLVVGLEIKREFTVGHLASARSAALPIAAAIGGMVVPAALYLAMIPTGLWSRGFGIPMATDTAFAVALIVMMGTRVPTELRIFLTAAAIVDDIGAILDVAVFYSGPLNYVYLLAAAAVLAGLALLNRMRIYSVAPYLALGVVLWLCLLASGLHATMAGVLLALFIPTRPPADLLVLMNQANAILTAEAAHNGEPLRNGPSVPAMRALDAIHERLESPAERLLRHAGARSSYVVLPLFALANAGVVLSLDVVHGHEKMMLAVIVGLVVGKPLGIFAASALAAWLGLAVKPAAYSWRQLAGAGALGGIGFAMSLFIAGQAFTAESDFMAAKLAIFAASILSAVIGAAVLWNAGSVRAFERQTVPDMRAAIGEPF